MPDGCARGAAGRKHEVWCSRPEPLLGSRRTAAREELRLQVGTLRFDLNALAEGKDKASRKTAQALKKKFLEKVRGVHT